MRGKPNSEGNSSSLEFELIKRIQDAAHTASRQLRKITSEIKKKEIAFSPLPKKGIIKRLGAVDGGNQTQSFSGTTIVAAKAAGAIFELNRLPEWCNRANVGYISLPRNVQGYVALIRDICEISVAIELLSKNPHVQLLDGSLAGYAGVVIPSSILPYLLKAKGKSDNPRYEYIARFKEYIYLFDRLLKIARKDSILLLGISKDSRARHLVRQNELSDALTDVVVVRAVSKGRTGYTPPVPAAYFLSSQVGQYFEQEKLLDGDYGNFLTSYFVLEKYRQPFRVDFPVWQEHRFDEIVKLMIGFADGEGFISPPHLVHNRARFDVKTMGATIAKFLRTVLEKDPELYDLYLRQQRRDQFG